MEKETSQTLPENISKCERVVVLDKPYKSMYQLILNNPKKINCLDYEMYKEIFDSLTSFYGSHSKADKKTSTDNPKRIVLIRGEGRGFCSGGNLKSTYEEVYLKKCENIVELTEHEYRSLKACRNSPPVSITLWHGAVLGFAVGFTFYSDIKVSTDTVFFSMPETKVGYFTDGGAGYFFTHSFGDYPELGLYMALTSERLEGKDLIRFGVSDFHCSQEKYSVIHEKLTDYIEKNLYGISDDVVIKSKIRDYLEDYCDYSKEKSPFKPEDFPFIAFIQYVFQFDSIFEVFKRIENVINDSEDLKTRDLVTDDSVVEWAKKAKKLLNERSPRALITVFELLKRGKTYDSAEAFLDFEQSIVPSYMLEEDFYEGIRALLVDKDNNPKWKNKSIHEVDYEALVKKYFSQE